MQLITAYERWFKGISKRPTFKRKKDGDSFTVFHSNGVVLIRPEALSKKGRKVFGSPQFQPLKKIKIPTLGTFRLKEPLDANYATQTFTISRQGNKWFVSFIIRAEKLPPLSHEVVKPTGIDLGIINFATLSDGRIYEAPKPMNKAKHKLAKFQWRNRNKQLRRSAKSPTISNRAKKFHQKLANFHGNIANIRHDFLHKTTTEISRKYAHIRIEDLNVQGMIANKKLSAAISDLGFYEFRRQLEYKQTMYATTVEIVDRWYPSSKRCSSCGTLNKNLKLSDREFYCANPSCGFRCDRDLNAAHNLSIAPAEFVRLARPEITPVDKKEPAPLEKSSKKGKKREADTKVV
ncbi:transposase [Nostoc sp. CHAB 5844]|nr:transposase [Nostoc sp. CHAB 5844]